MTTEDTDKSKSSRVTHLSDFWYMVEPMTQSMAELLYDNLDAEELDELEAVNVGRKEFVEQFSNSDRTAAFFAGTTLVFGVSANWVTLGGRKRRLWDTMSTRFVRENGLCMSFVKHTPEMIESFIIGEPTDSVIGICKSDFKRSRKWIEKVAKFKELGSIGINNKWHTVYGYTWGEV